MSPAPESAREVWITGLGVVAPGARDVAELARVLRAGDPVPESVFPTPFPLERFLDAPTVRKVARASELAQLAVVASGQALASAALPENARDETGVFWGTAFGPATYRLEFDQGVAASPAQASPLRFTEGVSNAASAHVSRVFGLRGASLTVLGGEDAGLSAIVAAFDRIAAGGARAIVAGGGEERSDLLIRALEEQGLVGRAVGRPFGPGRARFAQGAAALLLESADSARARGARPVARVLGAARRRGPDRTRAMEHAAREAVRRAGLEGLEARELERLDDRTAAVFGEGFAFTSALSVVAGALPLPEAPGALTNALVLATGGRGSAMALVLSRPSS